MWVLEVPVFDEAVGASAPQAEQSGAERSRVCLVSLHFKVPGWCFFCTVYAWIIPLCRPSSRVNPHLNMLETCWRHVSGLVYYSLVSFLLCLSPSSEIQWDMYHCSGGAAVLSKAVRQTTFCIKIINITGEDEHKKPACIFWTGLECPGVCPLFFFLFLIFLYVISLGFCCSFHLKELVIFLLFCLFECCLQSSFLWISVKGQVLLRTSASVLQ